jgi:hypothetical protein
VLRDLRDRTPHVDVDDVRSHSFDNAGRLRHLVGVAAEDLNRDRPLLLGVLRVLQRAIDAAHEPFAADHLSHDESTATVAFHQPAKCGVGHPRHR